jgi:hypothetical protein
MSPRLLDGEMRGDAGPLGSTAGAEKVGEEAAALFGEEAGDNFDFVVELRVVHYAED